MDWGSLLLPGMGFPPVLQFCTVALPASEPLEAVHITITYQKCVNTCNNSYNTYRTYAYTMPHVQRYVKNFFHSELYSYRLLDRGLVSSRMSVDSGTSLFQTSDYIRVPEMPGWVE